MSKTLIAVLTCSKYLDRRSAIRDTWFSWVEKLNPDTDVMFFAGKQPCLADDYVGDIVHLYCPDTYDELPQKTLKLIEYSLANGYERLIKADDDTFLMPLPEFLALLTGVDAVGNVRQHPPHNDGVDYLQGGLYSLSSRAMEAVCEHGMPKTGLEDGNLGKALKSAGIALTHTSRIQTDYRHGVPSMGNDTISAHKCTPQILHEVFDANHITLLSAYNQILAKTAAEVPEVPEVTLDVKPSGDDAVTIVVQSCGRLDLLRQTLASLSRCALDYPIKETIIYEDGDAKRPDWLRDTPGFGPIRWITGGNRVGQWMACDRLLDEVKTEYFLRVEDDFLFLPGKSAFLARSIEILTANPKIIQVSLRGSDTTSGHPVVTDPRYPFKIQERHWRDFWGGWSGNSHVARISDWRRIGSYGRVGGYGKRAISVERVLSQIYLGMGYSIAVLPDGPYIRHIGAGRSKAIDKLPPKAKVLIAVPACHKYAYGRHANDLKAGRQTEGRLDAVRTTWWLDFKPFDDYVEAKLFLGRPPDARKPLADEVFLPVEDDYEHLPHKMRAVYKWALEHGYDYVFKADDDGFLCVDRLLRTGYELCDQLGFSNCTHGLGNKCGCYITGGCGYFLSKRAMQAVIAEPITHWAEDLMTGKALRAKRFRRVAHPGFLSGGAEHYVNVDAILQSGKRYVSLHAVTPEHAHKLYGR